MPQHHGMNKPQPYMIGTNQTGHYRIAFQEALDRFRDMDPMEIAAKSGTDYNFNTGSFKVHSFTNSRKLCLAGFKRS